MVQNNKRLNILVGGSCPLGTVNSLQTHMSLNTDLSHLFGEPIQCQKNMAPTISGSVPTPTTWFGLLLQC